METTDVDFAAFLIRGLCANRENQTVHVQALIRLANQTLHHLERDVLAECPNNIRGFRGLQVPMHRFGQLTRVAFPEQLDGTSN